MHLDHPAPLPAFSQLQTPPPRESLNQKKPKGEAEILSDTFSLHKQLVPFSQNQLQITFQKKS